MSLVEVERALDALEAHGARMFDAASCDCVRTLITRAEELGGRTAELLCERAAAHLDRLSARFERERTRAEAALRNLEQQRGPLSKLRELLSHGDVQPVRRKLRRLASEPIKAQPATLPRVPQRRGRNSVDAADYEESLAELVASFALARALDVVPEHAGPYNPLRIASDLLTRMRSVSPIYLTAQLNRLEELASMMELPELPEPVSKTLPKKKRGALRSGSS
ncbi:MAG: uncharacterized protein JWN04_1979 [Myxococcaceae bacterium]|nr:uncharacterized protein [Myxococcaceae bacterium]